MHDTDVIVMATPVYFYAMCVQKKNLIDRTTPQYISNKRFYFIITAVDSEEENLERTFDSFRGFTEGCLKGAMERGI